MSFFYSHYALYTLYHGSKVGVSWRLSSPMSSALGEDWNQKKISVLEAKEMIEAPILEDVAKVLNVPVEAIKNFD